MQSVDFNEIQKLQSQGRWDEAGEILASLAYSLEKGGADFILICTNTMHKVADAISSKISIPLLHIADATASELVEQKCKKHSY